MNGEMMHTRRQQAADEDFLPDFSSASDLEFSEYNGSNTPALGRFGYVWICLARNNYLSVQVSRRQT